MTTEAPQAPSALSDLRTSLSDLIALAVSQDRLAQLRFAFEISLLAATNVLVLVSTNRALSSEPGTMVPIGELLSFIIGISLNWWLLGSVSRRALRNVNQTVTETSGRILRALGQLDLEQYEAIGRHEIIGRVSGDASRIVPNSNLIAQVLISLITVLLSVLYIATYSVQAAVLSLVGLFCITLLMLRINGEVMAQIRQDQEIHRKMREPIDDLLSGFKQLKQHRPRSEAVAAAFEQMADSLKNNRDQYHSRFYALDTISRHSFYALLGGVSFGLPLLLPEIATEASQLLISIAFTFRPMATVTMATPVLAHVGFAWLRLRSLSERLEAIAPMETESVTTPEPFQQLALRDVTFRYPSRSGGESFAVGPFNLELHPGEVIFVTGANGSGKSTFVKLLCGLYRRHGGDLLVDGQLLPTEPGPIWRSRFAAVFAEFELFERLYGLESIKPEQVAILLEQMELSHKVRFVDGCFNTVQLSTGQRKRLALVVALLQDRPIYVFDEWAADQDPHFREIFYRRIIPQLKSRGKTIVAVTHDDDAFDACDRRLHFNRGQLEVV